MAVTDPVADMLTRLRNAQAVRRRLVLVPASRMKVAIARILKEEGYIRDFEVTMDRPQPMIRIWLKYANGREPMMTSLKRVSKPGCRVYRGRRGIPWVLSGMGIAIISTPKGVLTDREARRLGVGGEVVCQIW